MRPESRSLLKNYLLALVVFCIVVVAPTLIGYVLFSIDAPPHIGD